ncbi:MAG: hypothetical protein IKZ23_02095 [Clostridia bacterium]|nr:hypothetical protein [Clostridia bacterium]
MAKVYDNPERYDNGKMTLSEWIGHIWYHYKWAIGAASVLIAFAVFTIVQLASKVEPDISIMHIGPNTLTQNTQNSIAETLEDLGVDYNEDGKVHTNIVNITVDRFTDEDNSYVINFDNNNEGLKRFQVEIRTGDSIIYLLEEYYFNYCVERELLVPFASIIDDADMPQNVIKGCGVKISDLESYKLKGIKNIPETAILCIRRMPNDNEISWGKGKDHWNSNLTAFKNLIKYGN